MRLITRGLVLAVVLAGTDAAAQFRSWTGTAGDNLWNTPGNWSPAIVPSAIDNTVIGQTSTINVANTSASVLTLTFFANSSLTCVGGTTMSVSGAGSGIALNTANTATFNCPVTLGAGGTGQIATAATSGGTISFTGAVSSSTGLNVTTAQSGIITFASTVSSTGALAVTSGASGSITFSGATNATSLTKTGTGTATLAGGGTPGPIAVNDGTLVLGSTVASNMTVQSAGTLSGAGTTSGTVNVVSGTVTPGSGGSGTLSTGPFTTNGVLNINFPTATTNTLVSVTGNATVGGTVNVTATGTITKGSYTILTATGTLTNNGVTVGSIPGGSGFVMGVRVSGSSLILDVDTSPIVVDGIGTGTGTCAASPTTWTHTIAASAIDRYAVVGVSLNGNPGGPTQGNVTSVSFGGQAMTSLGSQTQGRIRVFLFGVIPSSTGLKTVSVSTSGVCDLVGGSVDFTGVNQTTPTGTFAGSGAGASPISVNVTTAIGDRILDVLGVQAGTTATPGTGTSQRWNVVNATILGAGSTTARIPTAGTTNVSWTYTPVAATPSALGAIPLHAADPTLRSELVAQSHRTPRSVSIEWSTRGDVDSVGFRIWRESNGRRELLTPGFVEGPVLTSRATALAGHGYAWEDRRPVAGATYWVESLKLDGRTAWHPVAAGTALSSPRLASSALLGNTSVLSAPTVRATRSAALGAQALPSGDRLMQWNLASGPAAKVAIRSPGVYRLPAESLIGAGIPAGAPVSTLQLFVNGRQVPMDVFAADGAHLQPGDAVEFYGTGLSTRYTDAAIYWIVAGRGPARSLTTSGAQATGGSGATYLEAQEIRERLVWFGAVQNGDNEKFFGPAATTTPRTRVFQLDHLDGAGTGLLEAAFQGVTAGAHQVSFTVNGTPVGAISFADQELGRSAFALPPGLLLDGDATVQLVSSADSDISLESYVRLVYPRQVARGMGALSLNLQAGSAARLSGFPAASARVLDVTDPAAPVRLPIGDDGSGMAVVLAPGSGIRQLLAYLPGDWRTPASVTANGPSGWHAAGSGADLVIIGSGELLASLQPLVRQRVAEGLSVAVVDIADVQDEFAYGEKSATAVRDFLQSAVQVWSKAPRYVLLVGTGTYDPRDYLGLGGDLVPTGIVQTQFLESASDSWFTAFPGGGGLSIGRLPVRTPEETSLLAEKIAGRSSASSSASLLLVADRPGTSDFPAMLDDVRARVPGASATVLLRGSDTDAALHDQVLAALRNGPAVVDYAGHGAETFWSGDLLTVDDAAALAGSGKTSLFVHMTCLAGFFQDPRRQSLAVATLLADQGGAWGAWASTSMTWPADHPALNSALIASLLSQGKTLGEATNAAMAAVNDPDIRATFALLGDPSAQLVPSRSPALTVQTHAGSSSGCSSTGLEGLALPLLALVGAWRWLLRRRRLSISPPAA
jgi:hypothetical protein